MLSGLVKLAIFCVVVGLALAGAPSATKISASIKDTPVNGLEGFNVNIAAPFKFKDFLFGMRYNVGNLNKLPESLYARRSFNTPLDGVATIDTSYKVAEKVVNIGTDWKSDALGVGIHIDGDNKQYLKAIEVVKKMPIKSNRLTLTGAYNALRNSLRTSATLSADNTAVSMDYDTEDRSPTLTVRRALDNNNEISPSICLRTGDVSYAYTRKWEGGSLKSSFFPGEKLDIVWKDEGSHGIWSTAANIPINDVTNTKVSISHEWNY